MTDLAAPPVTDQAEPAEPVTKCPVTNWATDFDHADPAWATNPFPIWDELRATCPVAHTERYHGAWLPTRHEDVAAIAYDTEHFSSRAVIVSNVVPQAQAPIGGAPPISSDPPFHHHARRLILPAFAPREVEAMRGLTVDLCESLLDRVAGQDIVDAAVDYAQHIPPAVIARMLGLPDEDQDLFREFVHHVLGNIDAPAEERIAGFEQLGKYLEGHIEAHRAEPKNDLISYLLNAELFGSKLSPDHVRGTIVLILIAGIDTTWSAIGSALWHLAGNEADRVRLAAQPELMPTAIEELLRAYAPVTMARVVSKDLELGGVTMKEGEWVLLPFPAANRDPDVFERADEVVLDREVNRHSAFGLGIHRCAGSNLARMEMTVAVERWIARYGDAFTLADPATVTWAGGQVRGPRSIPVSIG